jgi:DNA repair protein RecO (recombination protein O)
VQLQAGYVLHLRPYRDTSALVELFTPQQGRVALVARGVRSAKSRWRGVLQVFQPLLLSWTQRGELGTLTGAEARGTALMMAPELYASGFYLNEILMRLLTRHDPQEDLFAYYDEVLHDLATMDMQHADARVRLESLLRRFELQLLATLGYGLVLDHTIDRQQPISAGEEYVYLFEQGPLAAAGNTELPGVIARISGQTLLALQEGDLAQDNTRREAKQLLRAVLGRYLGNKPLYSRELLAAREAMPAAGKAASTPESIPEQYHASS